MISNKKLLIKMERIPMSKVMMLPSSVKYFRQMEGGKTGGRITGNKRKAGIVKSFKKRGVKKK